MKISARTRIYGVIGDPVGHSLSPMIHNQWMQSAGLDAIYSALHLQGDQAALDIRSLYNAGLAGLNVTLPHKHAALEASVSVEDQCRRIGAANTLVRGDDGWHAHNTDAEGFFTALSQALDGESLSGKTVLMIGAGGAARAAVAALHDAGASLKIANRTVEKAIALAKALAPDAETIGLDQLDDTLVDADIVVNATSMGHGNHGLTLPAGQDRLFYDLSYGTAAATSLSIADQAGWRTEDGLGMLVEQARAAFKLWFNIDPDAQMALDMCRGSLESA